MTIQFPRVNERFLDRYLITEVLGAGGMSRVYGAIQDGLDRKVAIKLLAPAGAENLTDSQFDNIAARFEREAKLISSFRSSHTVVMYDFGRQEDYLFMILEHVDGVNLHQLVQESGPLPAERVARIMRQALSSLAEAHSMGILHRDIKPQNIMVYEHLGDPDNTKVLDFGIAKAIGETGRDVRKLTEERTIVGTPSYMSPEQILGNQLTAGSDIYSLGLVAYELLFGIVAVEADSAVSTMARHLAPTPIEIPDDRGMPAAFLDILRKMIAKDVGQRYSNAAEVTDDLNAWDGGDRSLTTPRITSPGIRHDTLEGPPPITGGITQESSKPLVLTGALLTVAILVAVGVVVALVAMMSSTPKGEGIETAAAAETVTAAPVAVPAVTAAIAEAPVTPNQEEPPKTDVVAVAATTAGSAEPATEVAPPPPDTTALATRRKKAAKIAVEPQVEGTDEAVDAVEPPEALVIEPAPQPQPAPEPVVKAVEPPPTTPPPVVQAQPTAEAIAAKEKEAAAAKKKKKKKKAPPLSF